mgnify:CR=1 FL=1
MSGTTVVLVASALLLLGVVASRVSSRLGIPGLQFHDLLEAFFGQAPQVGNIGLGQAEKKIIGGLAGIVADRFLHQAGRFPEPLLIVKRLRLPVIDIRFFHQALSSVFTSAGASKTGCSPWPL